jgi:hypothetical protein
MSENLFSLVGRVFWWGEELVFVAKHPLNGHGVPVLSDEVYVYADRSPRIKQPCKVPITDLVEARGVEDLRVTPSMAMDPETQTFVIPEQVKKLIKPRKDKTMNINSNLVSLLQVRKGVTTATVSILSGGRDTLPKNAATYTYKVPPKIGLEVDDLVIVQVRKDGLEIGKVREVHDVAMVDPEADFEYRWIVQKLDTSFVDAMAEEEQMLRRRLMQAEMMQRLEAATKLVGVDLDKITSPLLEGKPDD